MVDSHLSAVPEILAVIPIDDPAGPRRCARPACRGVDQRKSKTVLCQVTGKATSSADYSTSPPGSILGATR